MSQLLTVIIGSILTTPTLILVALMAVPKTGHHRKYRIAAAAFSMIFIGSVVATSIWPVNSWNERLDAVGPAFQLGGLLMIFVPLAEELRFHAHFTNAARYLNGRLPQRWRPTSTRWPRICFLFLGIFLLVFGIILQFSSALTQPS